MRFLARTSRRRRRRHHTCTGSNDVLEYGDELRIRRDECSRAESIESEKLRTADEELRRTRALPTITTTTQQY